MATVREKAREVGLEESIKLLIGISPADTSTQLQYCLDQMCNPATEVDPTVGDSEDEEDEVGGFVGLAGLVGLVGFLVWVTSVRISCCF